MASTSQGRALTEQHRLEQQQVRDEFLAEFLALWALLDSTRLDETGPGWVRAVMPLIRRYRLLSAQSATRYYWQFAVTESPAAGRIVLPPGVPRPAVLPRPTTQRAASPRTAPRAPSSAPAPRAEPARASAAPRRAPARTPEPVRSTSPDRTRSTSSRTASSSGTDRRARLNIDESAFTPRGQRRARIEIPDIDWKAADRAAVVSMNVTGPVAQKAKAARGRRLPEARDESLVHASGAATRHVLTGGRQSLLTLLEGDAQALGWARVTDGDPCAFCALLASRGPVYRSRETAAFQAHDACACTVEPVYSRQAPWPGRAAEFRRLYREVTTGTSGRDSLNAFRRAYEQRQRDARRSDVA